MSNQAPESAAPAKIARWSLLVLVAINILNFYDRHIAGALVEPMRREFSLSDTQIGGLNTAFTILYGPVGLPLGPSSSPLSRKKLPTRAVLVWTASTPYAPLGFRLPTRVLASPRVPSA